MSATAQHYSDSRARIANRTQPATPDPTGHQGWVCCNPTCHKFNDHARTLLSVCSHCNHRSLGVSRHDRPDVPCTNCRDVEVLGAVGTNVNARVYGWVCHSCHSHTLGPAAHISVCRRQPQNLHRVFEGGHWCDRCFEVRLIVRQRRRPSPQPAAPHVPTSQQFAGHMTSQQPHQPTGSSSGRERNRIIDRILGRRRHGP